MIPPRQAAEPHDTEHAHEPLQSMAPLQALLPQITLQGPGPQVIWPVHVEFWLQSISQLVALEQSIPPLQELVPQMTLHTLPAGQVQPLAHGRVFPPSIAGESEVEISGWLSCACATS